MKRWLLSFGAIGAVGLTLATLSDRPEPPAHGSMILPPASPPVVWRAAQTSARSALTVRAMATPQPAGAVIAPGVQGHLDDAEVRALHARLKWDGAANPGIWAMPAEFSAVD